jgi:hypothetical protein
MELLTGRAALVQTSAEASPPNDRATAATYLAHGPIRTN